MFGKATDTDSPTSQRIMEGYIVTYSVFGKAVPKTYFSTVCTLSLVFSL